MIGAELALSKTLLDALTMINVYDGPQQIDLIAQFSGDLEEDEAIAFPSAFARIISVLQSDLPRWRVAADLAVQLDLFEVVPALLSTLERSFDVHQAASLATLLQNPGVPEEVYKGGSTFLDKVDASHQLRSAIAVRRSPDQRPSSDLESILAAQSWPGVSSQASLSRLAPMIQIAGVDAPAATYWKAAIALAQAGARLRRLPSTWHRPPQRGWLSDSYPLVSWTGVAVARVRSHLPGFHAPQVLVTDHLEGPLGLPRLINQVNQVLPIGPKLRRSEAVVQHGVPAFSRDTLRLGAFDAAEMQYLGAATRATLRRLSIEALPPFESDVNRWSFSQLVTLRLLQSFKARGQRFRSDPSVLLGKLDEIASANERSLVGIDASGKVYVGQLGALQDITTGQQAFPDVLLVDEAFKPFELGGGVVPALLHPGRQTVVHPAVLGGTPCVEGRRLAARTLALMAQKRGMEVLRSAYPELTPGEIGDATAVGRAILATA